MKGASHQGDRGVGARPRVAVLGHGATQETTRQGVGGPGDASEREIGGPAHLRAVVARDPEVIVVEFEAAVVSADGNETDAFPFIQVIRVRDDKILSQRDYFDSFAMVDRLRAGARDDDAG